MMYKSREKLIYPMNSDRMYGMVCYGMDFSALVITNSQLRKYNRSGNMEGPR